MLCERIQAKFTKMLSKLDYHYHRIYTADLCVLFQYRRLRKRSILSPVCFTSVGTTTFRFACQEIGCGLLFVKLFLHVLCTKWRQRRKTSDFSHQINSSRDNGEGGRCIIRIRIFTKNRTTFVCFIMTRT